MRPHPCPCPRPRGWLALFGLLATVPAPSGAAVFHVPADHATVQAAVRVAAGGDTVLLAPGVHQGGVYVKGKALTLASRFVLDGDTAHVARTALQGVASRPCDGDPGCAGNAVVEFGRGADGSAVVGLTVSGGEDGVRSHSRVDVAHCRVIGNGDGVDYVSGSGGILRNSLFAWNRDDGIDLNGRVEIRVVDNDIRDNRQDGIEYRLHAWRGQVNTLEFTGNRITGNRGDGIQLIDYPDVSDRVIRIERNLFRANGDAGVGCMADGRTIEDHSGAPIAERVYLVHNTFIDERYGMVGGANVVALNNVFTGTRATAVRRVGGGSIVSHCLFWKNRLDHEESNVERGRVLRADPRLDAEGRPRAGSPAIDAGTAAYRWKGEELLVAPPGAYRGAAPDLGAFERADPAASPVVGGRDP